MVFTHKEHEGEPEFKRIRGGLAERFADRLGREHPDTKTDTSFGRNEEAIKEFGRLLAHLKLSEGRIVVNEVGAGVKERSAGMRGRIFKQNVSYEPFELLNGFRKAGIKPEGFVLNVIDIRGDVLLAVKSGKEVKVPSIDAFGEYFDGFFPAYHGKMKNHYIPVGIPKEYRERINCIELDIEKSAPPEKAHITFSFIQMKYEDVYLKSLARSTRKGGYIITHVEHEKKLLDMMGLDDVGQGEHSYAVYRVR